MALSAIFASSDAEQSGTDTSEVAVLASAALSGGVDYLVIYCGSVGANTGGGSRRGRLSLYAGSTRIARAEAHRADVSGGDPGAFYNAARCDGATIVTAAEHGGGTLEFRAMAPSGDGSTNEWYAGALGVVAIPLDQLVEGVDYFKEVFQDETELLVDASESAFETVAEESFTVPDEGNYLVLMSVEGSQNSNSSGRALRARFEVDGFDLADVDAGGGEGFQFEAHTAANHWHGLAWASLRFLSADSHTFRVRGESRTSATSDYRRARIVVVRAASFTALSSAVHLGLVSTSSSTYATGNLPTKSIDPEAAYVLLGSASFQQNVDEEGVLHRLRDTTNAQSAREDSGLVLGDGGFDVDSDLLPALMVHHSTTSGAHTWELQSRRTANTGRSAVDAAGGDGRAELIFWELQKVVTEVAASPVVAAAVAVEPGLLPQSMLVEPVVAAAVVVPPGSIEANAPVGIVTATPAAQAVLDAQAVLEARGYVVTLYDESTVNGSSLSGELVVVCMLNGENPTALATTLEGYITANKPFVVCYSVQTPTHANVRTTPGLAHLLGLVANTQEVTAGTPGTVALKSPDHQQVAPTAGWSSSSSLRIYAADDDVQELSTPATAHAGTAVVLGPNGAPVLAFVAAGGARTANVGGTFTPRMVWGGLLHGAQAWRRDGAELLAASVGYALGLYQNLRFPTL